MKGTAVNHNPQTGAGKLRLPLARLTMLGASFAINVLARVIRLRDRDGKQITVSTPSSDLGRHVFGAAALAFGLITLAWHDYNDGHQLRYFVYAAAAALIFGGAAIQLRRTAKAGAAVLAVALLTNRMALLATRLLTMMLVIFGLLVWVPLVLLDPHNHTNWSENAETFAIAGAVWILADLLGEYQLNEPRPR
jgi:hypothetical protein